MGIAVYRSYSNDVEEFDTFGELCEWLREELGYLADSAHEDISANGDSGDYESAYMAWQRYEALDIHCRNAANLADQWSKPINERHPAYYGDNSSEKLKTATIHFLSKVADTVPSVRFSWPIV